MLAGGSSWARPAAAAASTSIHWRPAPGTRSWLVTSAGPCSLPALPARALARHAVTSCCPVHYKCRCLRQQYVHHTLSPPQARLSLVAVPHIASMRCLRSSGRFCNPTTSGPKALVSRRMVVPREPGLEREAVSWFTRVYPRTRRPDWPGPRPLDIIQVSCTGADSGTKIHIMWDTGSVCRVLALPMLPSAQ